MIPLSRIAIAALLHAACGGSAEPARASHPTAGIAPADAADGGAPREEPAGATPPGAGPAVTTPIETIAPPSVEAIVPPPAEVIAAPPSAGGGARSQCEEMHAVMAERPLFERPPLPCERADRVAYHRRGADGACGPSIALAVASSGAVTISTTAAGDVPSADGVCPPALLARAEIEPGEARRLVASSCAALNAGYEVERGVGCRAAAVRLYFFEGDAKLGETAALPCPPHGLDRVVAELDALAAQLD